ncbi:hypothetical protein LMH73_019280 [Vibrio splendidus]|nr:hypothetical protein [Vibrio splendidus]MCC4883016.1 hypothetical protein [Vibrio splendidus]
MALLQPTTRTLIADSYNVGINDVVLLAITQAVVSPSGYADRMSYSGLYSVPCGDDVKYIKCDLLYASSLREVSAEVAQQTMDDCAHSKTSKCSPELKVNLTDLWLSKATFDALNLDINNTFSSYFLRMNADGMFGNLAFRKGDIVRYNSISHLDKFPIEFVSHVHVYSSYGEQLAPNGAWSMDPFTPLWRRIG